MSGAILKVGIYVSELDVKGGTHKQVLRLAQYLISKNHEILIITPRYLPNQGYSEFAGLPILSLPDQGGRGIIGKIKRRLGPIRLAMHMPNLDIVNVHDNRVILFAVVAKLLGKGRKYVWQINDLNPVFNIGAHSQLQLPPLRVYLNRIANRLWARIVDSITVNVSKNRERVADCLSQDSSVLYCGVDFPEAESFVQKSAGAFKLLTTGVFFPYRNYETLVHSCAIARRSMSVPIELTIVGDTRYNPEYAEYVRQIALSVGVDLTIRENLSQADLDGQFMLSHAFAFVNVDQSWGLSVFEAAARKKPVILSKSVGASELLSGRTGFLMVDPMSQQEIAAAILSLATDSSRLHELGEQAFNTVKDMSWDSMYCSPACALFERLLKA